MKKIVWLILCLISTHLFSQRVVDLSEWDGNLTIEGKNAFDSFGSSVAQGDFNGDGFADIIAGAPFSDPLGRNSSGSVYVFWGSAENNQDEQIDLSSQTADIEIFGAAANDQLGKVIAVGNINNDAYDDMIISAPIANFAADEAVGKVYVIFGSDDLPTTIDLLEGGHNRLYIGASYNDNLGSSLTCVDINSDGFEDLLIGSPNADDQAQINCGKAYLFYGSTATLEEVDLATSSADATFIGESLNDNFSESIISGNYDGDSFSDIAFGAPGYDFSNGSNNGKVYLLKGRFSQITGEVYLETSDLIETEIVGSSSSSIGERIEFCNFNGDNYDDIFITDFAANSSQGRIEAIFGSPALPALIELSQSTSNLSIYGETGGGIFGETLGSGFINNDSFEDIILGTPQAFSNQGLATVIYGTISPEQVYNLASYTPDVRILGELAGAETGRAIKVLDFNNDSRSDLLLGSPLGSSNKGTVTMIYGDLPFVTSQTPSSEQNSVEITTNLSFHIFDEIDGIDLSSISVNIAGSIYNSQDPNFSFSGTENDYLITILPNSPFGYNQQVDVSINAVDNAGWELPELIYRFFTREDTDPPFTDNWIPAPDSLGVPVETDLTFDVFDYGEGVDISSVIVQVQGIEYYLGASGFFYSGDANHYNIVLDPNMDFSFGETVQVNISASDLAEVPNAMSTFSYTFVCGMDQIPPVVISWDPETNEEVGMNYPIRVEVADFETGIDTESLEFYLDDLPILSQSTVTPGSGGDGVVIRYAPEAGNYYEIGQHTLRVVASDNAIIPNSVDSSSVFTCIEDLQPPITENHFPNKYEDNASTNTSFKVDILDLLTGVDESSISIMINDLEIIASPHTSVSQISNGYRVSYNPPERLQGQIDVEIYAADVNEPANIMAVDSYWFLCTPDLESPFILNANPLPDAENVPRGSNIYLELHDDKTGVNLSTIQLLVNLENVTSSLSINPVANGYSLFFTNPQLWDFNQDIFVEVSCSDDAIIPNSYNFSYSFHTVSDIDAPYLLNMDPTENQIGVTLDSDISFNLKDDGLGIDFETIRMFVDAIQVEPVITSVDSVFEYSVLYDPISDFSYGQEIEVAVFANDYAVPTNGLNNYIYHFTCVDDDNVPPIIRGMNPTPEANDVSVTTSISFEIIDGESGVSESSIIFKINNEFVTGYQLEEVSYGDTTGFRLHYTPEQLFSYGESVFVQIYASDTSSNFNDVLENYSFYCEEDLEPPVLVTVAPMPYSSGYPNTTFFFEFSDAKSGINPESFELRINEALISNYTSFEDDGNLNITYEPNELLFAGEQLMLDLSISDLLGNVLDSTFTVDIVADDFDPYLNPITPLEDSFTAQLGDHLILDILDKGMGIDPESITFSINGASIDNYDLIENPYNFSPDSLGYQIHFVLDEERHYEGQLVFIEVSAHDIAHPYNQTTDSYQFHIFKDLSNKPVKAIPPVITLNNDGYNDVCRLWINTDKSISKISGEIFSRHKTLMSELNIEQYSSNSFFADWDGKTENGKFVPGGLYLYRIEIDGKSFQGTITVAR